MTPPAQSDAPDPDWADQDLPAGSHYSKAEWEAARAGGHVVCEIRSGDEGALFQLPRAPANDPRRAPTKSDFGASPRVAAAPSTDCLSPLDELLLEGCLLLGPMAPTSHPRAATGLMSVTMPDSKEWPYRVVRPESDRQHDQKRFFFEVSGRLGWSRPGYERALTTELARSADQKAKALILPSPTPSPVQPLDPFSSVPAVDLLGDPAFWSGDPEEDVEVAETHPRETEPGS